MSKESKKPKVIRILTLLPGNQESTTTKQDVTDDSMWCIIEHHVSSNVVGTSYSTTIQHADIYLLCLHAPTACTLNLYLNLILKILEKHTRDDDDLSSLPLIGTTNHGHTDEEKQIGTPTQADESARSQQRAIKQIWSRAIQARIIFAPPSEYKTLKALLENTIDYHPNSPMRLKNLREAYINRKKKTLASTKHPPKKTSEVMHQETKEEHQETKKEHQETKKEHQEEKPRRFCAIM